MLHVGYLAWSPSLAPGDPSCCSKPCGELHPSEESLPMLEQPHAEEVAVVVVEVGYGFPLHLPKMMNAECPRHISH